MSTSSSFPSYASSFEEFERILDPCFSEFVIANSDGETALEECLPYLEGIDHSSAKVINRLAWCDNLLDIIKDCGRNWMRGDGVLTRAQYRKRLTCKKWYCEDCGQKNGRVHSRRFMRLNHIWGPITEKSACGQLVITVPDGDRFRFLHKKGPSDLQKIARKVTKKFFPGRKVVQSFQAFGDTNLEKFNPHVHSAIEFAYGETLKLSLEKLVEIRLYVAALMKKYGCTYDGDYDIHWNYARGVKQVQHMLRYLCRPNPGPDNRKALTDNPELLYFFMSGMSRFKYIRYYGFPRNLIKDSAEAADELTVFEKLAGEKIVWDWQDVISQSELELVWNPLVDERLSNDLLRMRSP